MNKYAGIVDRTKTEDAEDLAEKSAASRFLPKTVEKTATQRQASSTPVKAVKSSKEAFTTTRVTVSIPVDYDLALKELKAIRKLKGRKVTADDLILEALEAFAGDPEFAQCLRVAQERIKLYS